MATWTAGTALGTGALITQAWVQNVVNAQKFLAANDATYGKDLFFARQGTGQALSAGIAAALTFGGEDIDVAGGHDITTNTSRYTIKATGKYRLVGSVAIPGSTTAQIVVGAFYKNGSPLSNAAKCAVYFPNNSVAQTLVMPTIYASLSTTTNDYVELYVTATSAGFTTEITATQSCFGVEWVGA